MFQEVFLLCAKVTSLTIYENNPTFVLHRSFFQMLLKMLKVRPSISQTFDRFLNLMNSAKFSKIINIIVFKIFVAHQTFLRKISLISENMVRQNM